MFVHSHAPHRAYLFIRIGGRFLKRTNQYNCLLFLLYCLFFAFGGVYVEIRVLIEQFRQFVLKLNTIVLWKCHAKIHVFRLIDLFNIAFLETCQKSGN